MSNDFVRSMPDRVGLGDAHVVPGSTVDPLLLSGLLLIIGFGMMVLYSAIERDVAVLQAQAVRMGLALVAMVVAAYISPRFYLRWAPFIYAVGLIMCILVLLMGVTVKGATRWLEIPGITRFQPSELMKLAVPLMVAAYLHDRPLPPNAQTMIVALLITLVPALLIVQQPDLGTSVLVAGAGLSVIVLAGLRWRLMLFSLLGIAAAAPGLWYLLEDYQRGRILTLFDPRK